MPSNNKPAETFTLKKEIPSSSYNDWSAVFEDHPEVFLALASSIVKKKKRKNSKNAFKGRSLDAFSMPEFADAPFIDVFRSMWGHSTMQEMVTRTNLTISVLQRLKSGERSPSYREMEMIAEGFGCHKAFFLEYRIGQVLSSVSLYLEKNPETATSWFHKVTKTGKMVIKK